MHSEDQRSDTDAQSCNDIGDSLQDRMQKSLSELS